MADLPVRLTHFEEIDQHSAQIILIFPLRASRFSSPFARTKTVNGSGNGDLFPTGRTVMGSEANFCFTVAVLTVRKRTTHDFSFALYAF